MSFMTSVPVELFTGPSSIIWTDWLAGWLAGYDVAALMQLYNWAWLYHTASLMPCVCVCWSCCVQTFYCLLNTRDPQVNLVIVCMCLHVNIANCYLSEYIPYTSDWHILILSFAYIHIQLAARVWICMYADENVCWCCSTHGLLSFRTSQYKLHFYETPTGLKFVVNTDLNVGNMREALQHIYSQVCLRQYRCVLGSLRPGVS